MKKNKRLFSLIKSLTPTEKRYFVSHHSQANSKEKNYFRLFKEIDKQSVYNEKALKEKFRNEAFTKQFWVAKHYLYHLILKSLIQYKGTKSKLGWFTQEINKLEILHDKGLYEEAHQLSTNLKQQLAQSEMYAELLMVISLEIPLIKYVRQDGELKYPRISGKMEALHYLELLTNFVEYESIQREFNEVFVKRAGISETQGNIFDHVLSNPLIADESNARTERSKQILFFIKAVCSKLSGDTQAAYFYSKRLVDSSIESPETLNNPNSLPLALFNHVIISSEQVKPNLKEINQCINRLGDQSKYKSETLRFAMEKYYLARFRKIELRPDELETKRLIEELGQFLVENNLGDAFENRSFYALGMMNFMVEDHKMAFKYANLLLNKNKKLVEDDYLIFAHVMRLISAYELGLVDALPSYFRSSYRFISARDIKSTSVTLLLKLIRTQFISFNNSEKHLNALAESYLSFDHSEVSTFEKPYFYLTAWVDSKLNGISFVSAYKKMNVWNS